MIGETTQTVNEFGFSELDILPSYEESDCENGEKNSEDYDTCIVARRNFNELEVVLLLKWCHSAMIVIVKKIMK